MMQILISIQKKLVQIELKNIDELPDMINYGIRYTMKTISRFIKNCRRNMRYNFNGSTMCNITELILMKFNVKIHQWSISRIFYERICANILVPKKVQNLECKRKKVCAKITCIKCWWNRRPQLRIDRILTSYNYNWKEMNGKCWNKGKEIRKR